MTTLRRATVSRRRSQSLNQRPTSPNCLGETGEDDISGWRLTPAVPMRDVTGNLGVTDQWVTAVIALGVAGT
jgi:hypothetical protein